MINEAGGSRAPLNFLRHTIQHQPRWILLFASATHLDELADYWSDYLINTHTLHISYLEASLARELIIQPVTHFPSNVYSPAAVDKIIAETRCQPYLVQLLCFEVINYLNQQQRQTATELDIETIIPQALETGGEYFKELWRQHLKQPAHQTLITYLLNQQPLPDDRKTINYLIHKEIIEAVEGGYRFQVPLIERFMMNGEWLIKNGE